MSFNEVQGAYFILLSAHCFLKAANDEHIGKGKQTGGAVYRPYHSSQFKGWNAGSRYKLTRRLGHGSYGEVIEAKGNAQLACIFSFTRDVLIFADLVTNEKVAVKRLAHIFDDVVDAKRVLREMCILRYLKHDNLIRLLDVTMPKVPFQLSASNCV